MRVVIVGTGYVGLVTGACLADMGHEVVCVDQNTKKIATLRSGSMPFFEPGLAEVIARTTQAGHLSFTDTLAPAASQAEVIFICVGTPARMGERRADLSAVQAAAHEIARAILPGALVVLKSTVPVGTCDSIEKSMRSERADVDFCVLSNPEFLRQGCALQDFTTPDRIIIGTDDAMARERMAALYGAATGMAPPILFTSRRSAEMTKYAANAFLATKIAFINEVADLCERTGAEIRDVAMGIGMDKRIGPDFLNAGPGFGGSCFPKDTLALMELGRDQKMPVRIVEATVAANEERKRRMAWKVAEAAGGMLRGKRVGVLGLTFKASTDDMRDAPSLGLIEAMAGMGAFVQAHDPAGMQVARPLLPKSVSYCPDAYSAADKAHVLVLMTEWDAFRTLDLDRVRSVMTTPIVVDLRNLLDPDQAVAAGFAYHCVGSAARNCEAPAIPSIRGRQDQLRERREHDPVPLRAVAGDPTRRKQGKRL